MGTAPMCACGVPDGSAAPRCKVCPLAAVPASAGAPADGPAFARRQGAPLPSPVMPPSARHSRWAKSQTSFGPVGRVVATIALFVPLVVLAATVVTGIGIVGAGIYAIVFVPWGLKDIWKKTRLPDEVG